MYIVTPTEKWFTMEKENEFVKESMLDLRLLNYIVCVSFIFHHWYKYFLNLKNRRKKIAAKEETLTQYLLGL